MTCNIQGTSWIQRAHSNCAIKKSLREKKQTHRYREQTSGYQLGEGRREGQYRGRGVRGTNYYE